MSMLVQLVHATTFAFIFLLCTVVTLISFSQLLGKLCEVRARQPTMRSWFIVLLQKCWDSAFLLWNIQKQWPCLLESRD